MKTKDDKEYDLREIWIKTRKQRLESSMSQKYKNEFATLNKDISDLIRSLRRQIDKYLVKNSLPPHFGNYIRFYDKEELLYDAEINFHQIKKFLNQKTSILQKDELIAKDYLDLMSYITRKKLMENSIAKFEKPQFYTEAEENIEKMEDVDEDDVELIKPLQKMTSSEYSELFTYEQSEEADAKTKEKRLKDKLISHFEDQLKQAYGKQLQQEKAEDKEKEKEANKGKKKKQQLKGKEAKKDKELKKKDKKDKKTKK